MRITATKRIEIAVGEIAAFTCRKNVSDPRTYSMD